MLYIKDIFKACVCSFCDNIYEYDSIDDKDFIGSFKSFCNEVDLQNCLEACTSETNYDIENINNICDNLPFSKYKNFEIKDIIEICKNSYKNTIEKDKTINIEAFVDNLAKEFTKAGF